MDLEKLSTAQLLSLLDAVSDSADGSSTQLLAFERAVAAAASTGTSAFHWLSSQAMISNDINKTKIAARCLQRIAQEGTSAHKGELVQRLVLRLSHPVFWIGSLPMVSVITTLLSSFISCGDGGFRACGAFVSVIGTLLGEATTACSAAAGSSLQTPEQPSLGASSGIQLEYTFHACCSIASFVGAGTPISKSFTGAEATKILRFALAHTAKAISKHGHLQEYLRSRGFCRALALVIAALGLLEVFGKEPSVASSPTGAASSPATSPAVGASSSGAGSQGVEAPRTLSVVGSHLASANLNRATATPLLLASLLAWSRAAAERERAAAGKSSTPLDGAGSSSSGEAAASALPVAGTSVWYELATMGQWINEQARSNTGSRAPPAPSSSSSSSSSSSAAHGMVGPEEEHIRSLLVLGATWSIRRSLQPEHLPKSPNLPLSKHCFAGLSALLRYAGSAHVASMFSNKATSARRIEQISLHEAAETCDAALGALSECLLSGGSNEQAAWCLHELLSLSLHDSTLARAASNETLLRISRRLSDADASSVLLLAADVCMRSTDPAVLMRASRTVGSLSKATGLPAKDAALKQMEGIVAVAIAGDDSSSTAWVSTSHAAVGAMHVLVWLSIGLNPNDKYPIDTTKLHSRAVYCLSKVFIAVLRPYACALEALSTHRPADSGIAGAPTAGAAASMLRNGDVACTVGYVAETAGSALTAMLNGPQGKQILLVMQRVSTGIEAALDRLCKAHESLATGSQPVPLSLAEGRRAAAHIAVLRVTSSCQSDPGSRLHRALEAGCRVLGLCADGAAQGRLVAGELIKIALQANRLANGGRLKGAEHYSVVASKEKAVAACRRCAAAGLRGTGGPGQPEIAVLELARLCKMT